MTSYARSHPAQTMVAGAGLLTTAILAISYFDPRRTTAETTAVIGELERFHATAAAAHNDAAHNLFPKSDAYNSAGATPPDASADAMDRVSQTGSTRNLYRDGWSPEQHDLSQVSFEPTLGPRFAEALAQHALQQTPQIAADLSDATRDLIKQSLPFPITPEQIAKGTANSAGMVDGAIADLGASLSPPDREAALAATQIMYRLGEALAEAHRLGVNDRYSAFAQVRTIEDLFRLSAADRATLGNAVSARGAFDHMQFGTAFQTQFMGPIRNFVSNPALAWQAQQYVAGLGWRTR